MAAVAATAILLAPSVQAQDRWSFTVSEQVDLWYHGLALTGYRGFAALPMYDADYAAAVRGRKQELGIYPTRLDRLAGQMLRALETDSTFEVLHFVPLYFASAGRADMLTAVERVAQGRAAPTGLATRFGASVVSNAIVNADARDLLVEFVQALRDEWSVFLEGYRGSQLEEARARLPEVMSYWQFQVMPRIEQLLSNQRLRGGIVFLSPAIGGEGRIFAGDPANTRDNVIVTGYPAHEPQTVAFKTLREICFPIASASVSRLGMDRDRTMAERTASAAAVQCGKMVVESALPALVDGYVTTFLEMSPAAATGSFDTAFPVPDRLLSEMGNSIP